MRQKSTKSISGIYLSLSYFRSQIDSLRNEMMAKKANIDKMKMLLEHYKCKVSELEQELTDANERWAKRCEDERKKWKIYLNQ
jgi:peptidoglycan hydrolase CwlO-like protein